MFHNSCYVVLDLAVVPNPLLYYQKTPNHTIILSYHQIIIEAILQMHFPENGTRHFSKNFDKRPGETAIHNGFRYKSWDVWPNSPKSGMWKFSVRLSENFSSVRPKSFCPSVRPKFFRPSVRPSENFPSVRPFRFVFVSLRFLKKALKRL